MSFSDNRGILASFARIQCCCFFLHHNFSKKFNSSENIPIYVILNSWGEIVLAMPVFGTFNQSVRNPLINIKEKITIIQVYRLCIYVITKMRLAFVLPRLDPIIAIILQ